MNRNQYTEIVKVIMSNIDYLVDLQLTPAQSTDLSSFIGVIIVGKTPSGST